CSSTLTIPLTDLIGAQASSARMDPLARAHDQDQHQLIGARCTRYSNFNRIQMAANIARIDVRQRHIERTARRTDLLGRGHDGQRIAAAPLRAAFRLPTQYLAQPIAAGGVPERSMLELAVGADDRALAVTLYGSRLDVQRRQQACGEFASQRLELLH